MAAEIDRLGLIAPFVEELEVHDLRWLLSEVLGEMQREVGGIAMLLIVDAIGQCADDGDDPTSLRGYEEWRRKQPSPDGWPSPELIRVSCGGNWAPALVLTGIPVPSNTRGAQRKNRSGFTREEAERALRSWARDARPDRAVFGKYKDWANQRMQDDPLLVLPANPGTFIKLFGSWAQAISDVIPGLRRAEAEDRAQQLAVRDAQVLSHLRAAASDMRCDVMLLSRPAYDEWAKAMRHAGKSRVSSHTVTRRFKKWELALVRAAVME